MCNKQYYLILLKALEKVEELRKDNKDLKDENQKLLVEAETMRQEKMNFQQENELLHQKIADMTKEKADMEKKKGQFVEMLENENSFLKDEKKLYEQELTKRLATIKILEKKVQELEQKVGIIDIVHVPLHCVIYIQM